MTTASGKLSRMFALGNASFKALIDTSLLSVPENVNRHPGAAIRRIASIVTWKTGKFGKLNITGLALSNANKWVSVFRPRPKSQIRSVAVVWATVFNYGESGEVQIGCIASKPGASPEPKMLIFLPVPLGPTGLPAFRPERFGSLSADEISVDPSRVFVGGLNLGKPTISGLELPGPVCLPTLMSTHRGMRCQDEEHQRGR